MSYRVKFSARAAAQIQQAASWWLEHRSAAPDAFLEELERAGALIRTFPDSGQGYANTEKLAVRRVPLRRVRYHLYYIPGHNQHVIEVIALWHSSPRIKPDAVTGRPTRGCAGRRDAVAFPRARSPLMSRLVAAEPPGRWADRWRRTCAVFDSGRQPDAGVKP